MIGVEFYTVREAASLTGLSRRRLGKLFRAGKLRSAIRHEGRLLIPLVGLEPYIKELDIPELAGFSATKRRAVVRKLRVLARYERLMNKSGIDQGGRGRRAVKACRICGVSQRSLWRWKGLYKQKGLCGLVDHRGGVY